MADSAGAPLSKDGIRNRRNKTRSEGGGDGAVSSSGSAVRKAVGESSRAKERKQKHTKQAIKDDPSGKKKGSQKRAEPGFRVYVYEVVRLIIMLIVFYLLHSAFDKHIMKPYVQNHRQVDEEMMRKKVATSICPEGAECNFRLKPEFERYRED